MLRASGFPYKYYYSLGAGQQLLPLTVLAGWSRHHFALMAGRSVPRVTSAAPRAADERRSTRFARQCNPLDGDDLQRQQKSLRP